MIRFTVGGTAISWSSQKQTFVATSSNHAETIALHKESRNVCWLRSISQHIYSSSGICVSPEPTILYKDNAVCVAQIKEGYQKRYNQTYTTKVLLLHTRTCEE